MTTPRRPNSPPWTPEQLAEATALYAEGYGCVTIGRALGCPSTTAFYRLRGAGVVVRPREAASRRRLGRRIVPDSTVDEWVREYQAGSTAEAIAERHGCGTTTVYRYLQERPGVVRVRSRGAAPWCAEALRLKRRGMTWVQIGARYGRDASHVAKECKRAILEKRVRA